MMSCAFAACAPELWHWPLLNEVSKAFHTHCRVFSFVSNPTGQQVLLPLFPSIAGADGWTHPKGLTTHIPSRRPPKTVRKIRGSRCQSRDALSAPKGEDQDSQPFAHGRKSMGVEQSRYLIVQAGGILTECTFHHDWHRRSLW